MWLQQFWSGIKGLTKPFVSNPESETPSGTAADDADYSNTGQTKPQASASGSDLNPTHQARLNNIEAQSLAANVKEKEEIGKLRACLFFVSGATAIVFLIVFASLCVYYIGNGFLLKIAILKDWHAFLATDAIFFMILFVPLSIFWTLAKIVHGSSPEPDKKNDDATLIGSLTSLFGAIKDCITSVQSAIKGTGK